MSHTSRPNVQARNKQFIAGIGKRLKNVKSLAIAGKVYTPSQLEALFQAQSDKADAISTARAVYQDAKKAYVDHSKQIASVIVGFRQQIRNLFGTSEALSDFGLAPPKVTKPTLETKVGAAQKRKQTRDAGGTKAVKKAQAQKGAAQAEPQAQATTKPTA